MRVQPLRVAFAGRESLHGRHALRAPAGGLRPRFFDVRAGTDGLAEAIDAWGAHVVVALGVEAAALAGVRAATLGVVAEPLPRERGVPRTDQAPQSDGFDRLATCDAAVPGPVWRTFALPVDDALYAPVRPSARPPRALFVGGSDEHRERFLIPAKHEYDVLHHAHGLHGAGLRDAFARTDVAINLHHEPWPAFHSAVLAHLAAGHLVISEPLDPSHGLEPGIDHLEVRRPDQLLSILFGLQRRPDTHERVRLRGREQAEAHRASVVWPRVIGDLIADLRAFPSARDPVR